MLKAELGALAEDSPGVCSEGSPSGLRPLEERTTRRKRSLLRGDTHADLTSGKEGPARRQRKHSKLSKAVGQGTRRLFGVASDRSSGGGGAVELERQPSSSSRHALNRQPSPVRLGGKLVKTLSPSSSSWSRNLKAQAGGPDAEG